MPVGDEPLIPIGAWPGVTARYAFAAGAPGSATLTVEVAFDPADVEGVARQQYAAILDQIADPRVAVSVTSALAEGPVALAAGEQDARAALAGLVGQIVAFLDSGPAPATVTLSGTLPRADVARIAADLFPVWVSVEIVREGEPHSLVSARLAPSADSVAALAGWAGEVEAAFASFDGKGGLLKVLSASTLGANGGGSVAGEVWALRWSPSAVAFANAGGASSDFPAPVYHSPMPLSTELLAGTVDIVSYDDAGSPVGAPAATGFSGIDLDVWARSFLAALHKLGGLDPALTAAKEDIASAIASGVSSVYADAGDVEAARTVFRQSLLDTLSTAFATSAIVQVPATVSLTGPDGVPELVGTPTARDAPGRSTFTTATLPVVEGTAWLTSLAQVADPARQSGLCLSLSYDIAFVDQPSSSRLSFVLPHSDTGTPDGSVLEVPVGTLDIPIPLRAHPAPPRLVSQAVTADHETPATLATSVMATYTLTVGTPAAAQDELRLSLRFDGSADASAAPATGGSHPLFGPLAAFESFRDSGYLDLARAAILGKVPGAAERWLDALRTRVRDVAAAWPRGPGPPPRASEAVVEPGEAEPPAAAPPARFALQVPDEAKPVLVVRWTGEPADPPGDDGWPQIAGATSATVDPLTRSYVFGTLPAEVALSWSGLSVVTHQRISAAAQVVRNERLGAVPMRGSTNPGLIYRTPTLGFEHPVVPLLEVTNTITLDSASLAGVLDQLVAGVMTPAEPPAQVEWSIEASYAYTLGGGDPDAAPVETRVPLLLSRVAVTTAAAPPPGVDTTATLSARLAAQIGAWYATHSPASEDARLVFSIRLFAEGGEQPILRLSDVEAPVGGAGWWPPAQR